MLNCENVDWVEGLLYDAPPGIYTAAELFGDTWCCVRYPGLFGRALKASVLAGVFPELRCLPESGGLQQYEVMP